MLIGVVLSSLKFQSEVLKGGLYKQLKGSGRNVGTAFKELAQDGQGSELPPREQGKPGECLQDDGSCRIKASDFLLQNNLAFLPRTT